MNRFIIMIFIWAMLTPVLAFAVDKQNNLQNDDNLPIAIEFTHEEYGFWWGKTNLKAILWNNGTAHIIYTILSDTGSLDLRPYETEFDRVIPDAILNWKNFVMQGNLTSALHWSSWDAGCGAEGVETCTSTWDGGGFEDNLKIEFLNGSIGSSTHLIDNDSGTGNKIISTPEAIAAQSYVYDQVRDIIAAHNLTEPVTANLLLGVILIPVVLMALATLFVRRVKK